ncbi:MAG TPA: hypothetical protein VGQ83_08525, partial [Polyangia bacterium]
MTSCDFCGHENPDVAVRCGRCGQAMARPAGATIMGLGAPVVAAAARPGAPAPRRGPPPLPPGVSRGPATPEAGPAEPTPAPLRPARPRVSEPTMALDVSDLEPATMPPVAPDLGADTIPSAGPGSLDLGRLATPAAWPAPAAAPPPVA